MNPPSLPIPWSSEDVSLGNDLVCESRLSLLTLMRDLINAYTGLNESIEYYDFLAGDWLLLFSQNIYIAFREIQLGHFSDLPSEIPQFTDTQHFTSYVNDPSWQPHIRWMISRLLSNSLFSGNIAPVSKSLPVRRGSTTRGILRSTFVNSIARLSTQTPRVLLIKPLFRATHFSRLKFLLHTRNFLSESLFPFAPINNVPYDYFWRLRRSEELSLGTSLSDILKSLIPLYLPLALLENFFHNRESIHSLNIHRPRAVVSAYCLNGHLPLKIKLAQWRSKGTLLAYQQHGGGYGIDAHFHPCQTYQINQSDVFYSWGWNSSDSKVKPLPLPLEINRKSYSSQSGKILLSCIDGPPFPYKLDLGQMPANMSQHLNTLELLSALPKSLDLTLSPYHHDFGRKILDKMIAAFPNVLIDYKTRGIFRYLGYNLIVHNYLGTIILNQLVSIYPQSVFLNQNFTNSLMIPCLYQFLGQIGILHSNPLDAARFISDISHNFDDWWFSHSVQSARSEFAFNYARFSPNWSKVYCDEFESLAEA